MRLLDIIGGNSGKIQRIGVADRTGVLPKSIFQKSSVQRQGSRAIRQVIVTESHCRARRNIEDEVGLCTLESRRAWTLALVIDTLESESDGRYD